MKKKEDSGGVLKLVFTLLEGQSRISIFCQFFLFFLIVTTAVTAAIITLSGLSEAQRIFLESVDAFITVVFTVEFFLRLVTAPYKFSGRSHSYYRYLFSFEGVVDFLSVAPFWFLGSSTSFVRVLRLFRLIRILKLERYTKALTKIIRIFRNKASELLAFLSIAFVLIYLSSVLIYATEHQAQPEVFSSIPHTMWWAVVTFTTVGYGDAYPVTTMGRILASFIMVLGVSVIAIPTAIVASGFIEEHSEKQQMKCPYCGKELKEKE